jgi:hypothetical protein
MARRCGIRRALRSSVIICGAALASTSFASSPGRGTPVTINGLDIDVLIDGLWNAAIQSAQQLKRDRLIAGLRPVDHLARNLAQLI